MQNFQHVSAYHLCKWAVTPRWLACILFHALAVLQNASVRIIHLEKQMDFKDFVLQQACSFMNACMRFHM